MEKIGYIIRYNDSDEKGVLVYGYNIYKNNPQNRPISFSKSDCVSEVKTGQLVYFNLDDNKATHIERASLGNFKRDIISEIASCYDSDGWDSSSLYISYRPEDLIDDSDHDKSCDETSSNSGKRKRRKSNKLNLDDDEINIYCSFACISRAKYEEGKAKKIDILNIERWLDEEIVKGGHLYGTTAKEVLDLFNLFVAKRRNYCRKQQAQSINSSKENDNSISPSWKFLLASLSNNDLRMICEEEPMLQPALPCDFCFKNLDVLSINFGFPDMAVCEAYYKYRLGVVKSTSEYRFMSKKINNAIHCETKHKDNEGAQACQMGENKLQRLTDLLENQYQTAVLNNVKQQLSFISENKINGEQRVSGLLKDGNFGYLEKIGNFIDAYNGVIYYRNCLIIRFDCNCFEKIDFVFDAYEGLMEEDKTCLFMSINRKINACIKNLAKEQSQKRDAYRICFIVKKYPQFITCENIESIREIVNIDFAKLDNIEELDRAVNCGLISEEQHLGRYKEITKDFDIAKLLGIIEHNYDNSIPRLSQTYLIKEIIKQFDFKTLKSFNYVKLEYDAISNLESLIKWLNHKCELGYLDSIVWEKTLKDATDKLSREEKWQLFDKGLIPSPGIDNIREYLDDAYNQNRFENKNEYFRKDCFQDVMCTDILTADDNKLKFLIAEHLDQKHQRDLLDKCEGVVKLYLWVMNPDDIFDWNLITSYFSELPAEKQIRLFRYIFYLIAKKNMKISIDELYKIFVESEKKACHGVRGIVYLLKEQLSPIGTTKSEKLDEIIGEGFGNIHKFLLAKTFFYPCNGHLALTRMSQDRDYQTYNGYVEKISVQGKEYYSISFYDTPRDIYGRELDWPDDKDILRAKAVLETNINTKIIDGNYIVNISEEMAIKQFIMAYDIDDHCCLLDAKQAMIEKGYLAPNNSYQPLYTNYIRPYDDDSFDACRCINYIDVDPIDGIPFYWCNKKPCVRRCNYILPLSEWEKYKLSDFIYILLGSETVNLSKVWNMTSEISQFLNSYLESKRSKNESNESSDKEQLNTQNLQINKSDEIGVLTEESSVVQDIYDDDEEYDDYGGNYNDSSYYEDDKPTFERYNGSYAQDEMGYSDDDIDTIFDGDPSAYWNID